MYIKFEVEFTDDINAATPHSVAACLVRESNEQQQWEPSEKGMWVHSTIDLPTSGKLW